MLRLTARTLKTVFRSSLLFKRMPSIAMFCTDKTPTPKEETPSSKLANHLKEEIAYEKENAPKVNDSLELMKKQGWTVKAEGTMIDMTKTVGNKTIHIVFSARSPPPEDPTEEENKKGEEEPDSDFNELTVYILKEGSNKVMFADFITSQGQVRRYDNSDEYHDIGLHQGLRTAQKNYEARTQPRNLWRSRSQHSGRRAH